MADPLVSRMNDLRGYEAVAVDGAVLGAAVRARGGAAGAARKL
jgi:hypothetical protein